VLKKCSYGWNSERPGAKAPRLIRKTKDEGFKFFSIPKAIDLFNTAKAIDLFSIPKVALLSASLGLRRTCLCIEALFVPPALCSYSSWCHQTPVSFHRAMNYGTGYAG
jgi:hypothetical protein